MLIWTNIIKWISENISMIDSVLNVLNIILTTIFIIGMIIIRQFIKLLSLKLKSRQFKNIDLPLYAKTKKSMKYYIPTRGQLTDPCEKEEGSSNHLGEKLVSLFIKKVFKDSDDQFFIILGDSGMGKTTFLLNLYLEYQTKLFKKYKIELKSLGYGDVISQIKDITDKSNTILLLDSFDEDKMAVINYEERLKEICQETALFYKVIMTCRTQFFPNSEREPKYTDTRNFGVGNKNAKFTKYYISPFSNKEINSYINKKYNWFFQRRKNLKAKKIIINCSNLMVRPMLLANIEILIENNSKIYNTAYEIYKELVTQWLKREEGPIGDAAVFYEFSEKVAQKMYDNQTIYIEEKEGEIEQLCRDYNIPLKTIDAKSRTLLNRNAEGIYKFAHKSFLEYFLAEKAFNELEFRKKFIINQFKGYDMVKHFLRDMSVLYFEKLVENDFSKSTSFNFKYLCFDKYFFYSNESDLTNADFEGCSLRGAYFFNMKLMRVCFKDADLQEANLECSDLRNANLENANLENALLNEANLENANLRNVKFTESYLAKANLKKSNMEGANLNYAYMDQANLEGTNLTNTILEHTYMNEVNLKEANLINANLEQANLENANLESTNLNNVNLKSARLVGAILKGANLENANLEGANLRNANLEKQDLRKTNLKNAVLSEANLKYINLAEVDLSKMNLSRSCLKGANLTFAFLYKTNLAEADLQRASLQDAIFQHTDLRDAVLDEVNLYGSFWLYNDIMKILSSLKEPQFISIIILKEDGEWELYKDSIISTECMQEVTEYVESLKPAWTWPTLDF